MTTRERDETASILSREELEAREAQWLAPFAMKSRDTRGRQHAEPEDPCRTVYRRDRDRMHPLPDADQQSKAGLLHKEISTVRHDPDGQLVDCREILHGPR